MPCLSVLQFLQYYKNYYFQYPKPVILRKKGYKLIMNISIYKDIRKNMTILTFDNTPVLFGIVLSCNSHHVYNSTPYVYPDTLATYATGYLEMFTLISVVFVPALLLKRSCEQRRVSLWWLKWYRKHCSLWSLLKHLEITLINFISLLIFAVI